MRYMLLLLIVAYADGQPADPWKALQFLAGEWVGEGSGSPGEGIGGCSFDFDLQKKVMIRKNFAVYPASRHDDLMVIYFDAPSKGLKAIYFDSEEHVIHYSAESTTDSVRFLSDPIAGQPGYRLTYRTTGADKVSLDFDIAPPGKPFSSYIHAALRKKK